MNYDILLDHAVELGYRLAMSGAETFRVEESIVRMLAAYGIDSEVFVIPNCLHVSIETADGRPITRMRRIGHHGNDLDSVEVYSNLSREICSRKPDTSQLADLFQHAATSQRGYGLPMYLLGHFLSSAGFAVFFQGSLMDALCAGICGLLIGLVNRFFEKLKVNQFFSTIAAAFLMTILANITSIIGFADNTDAVIIGALMLLVPGLLFTNAMRDIIFGDTNSGTNRIVQVLLIAAAIALGTGTAWNLSEILWMLPSNAAPITYSYIIQCLAALVGCAGFAIIFNIHGFGSFLCCLGGAISWAAYCAAAHFGCGEIVAYFIAAVVSAIYSETMARIRKYPAISYLVISIFPMIPGAGIYYTTGYLVRGDMSGFAEKGTTTVAIAGVIAVGILMISTIVRLWGVKKQNATSKKV